MAFATATPDSASFIATPKSIPRETNRNAPAGIITRDSKVIVECVPNAALATAKVAKRDNMSIIEKKTNFDISHSGFLNFVVASSLKNPRCQHPRISMTC